MANLQFDIQNASASICVPLQSEFERWVNAALNEIIERRSDDDQSAENAHADVEVSLRIVDLEEGAALNHQWRQKDKPTNVLSFPSDLPEKLGLPFLGDLVVCAPVVEREAKEQNKSLKAHWAHMLIHGTLHLLGYDHIEDRDAEVMESLEVVILQSLGFPDPYRQE